MESNAPLFERLGGRPALLKLLAHFYKDVRQHRELGPIFEAQIKDWPAHIENIATFWTQVTGGPPGYGGGMPQQHIPLDCAGEINAMAQQIGLRLRQFCGVPQPPPFILHS
ncbi:MAG TPA: globin [Verrucomicrobiae bacterium]|jgi:hemoglobin